MRIKSMHRALRGRGCCVVEKEGRRERSEQWSREIFYTPRKRRLARARALPDAGVAVSACGLAV